MSLYFTSITNAEVLWPPDRKRHDGVLVDHEFLMKLQGKLEKAYGRDTLSVAPGSEGTNYYSEDGQPKPLEYLITCVPGIEVRPLM